MKKIFIIGSINTDFTICVDKMPLLGETRKGHNFKRNQGGKGANQAVACKKLGCKDVSLIASVGNDEEGLNLIKEISSYGINVDLIHKEETISTGTCLIILDEYQKDNILILETGANNFVKKNYFEDYLLANAKSGDILITQLEINLDAVYDALKIAKNIGMYTILNPAPASDFDYTLFKYVDLIVFLAIKY